MFPVIAFVRLAVVLFFGFVLFISVFVHDLALIGHGAVSRQLYVGLCRLTWGFSEQQPASGFQLPLLAHF